VKAVIEGVFPSDDMGVVWCPNDLNRIEAFRESDAIDAFPVTAVINSNRIFHFVTLKQGH
jgi:hypothetical protein